MKENQVFRTTSKLPEVAKTKVNGCGPLHGQALKTEQLST